MKKEKTKTTGTAVDNAITVEEHSLDSDIPISEPKIS